MMAGVWIVVTLLSIYFKSQLKGLTGDNYGAINEIAVVSVFLIVSMLAFKHWLI